MSLALYRKYRPGRLDDVIGQDHVIEPLKRALSSDRVHHAYLFSGPRGCGKTSSARILARSLNCEQGPTPDPCGECNSCRDLAPNGPGSIDVIELDAATHGLVDDARDLREKAVYAPASSRYKIYIIDEAHQLGPGAANALLKLVEEPPPHLRFVFATTEPEKIIGTIRSRTHHYGFRLVPSRILQTHLAWTCEQEGLTADPAALALVARAAGGSVRDALSILGQLLAGAGPDGLTYEDAVAQLGVTDAALIDQIIVALAERDGSQLFRLVDSVIEAGHDPRRFVADLLDRFRDLLIVSQVPDAAEAGLIEGQPERVQELVAQASQFGPGELSRSADVISRGLSDLKGATAPRLQIELLIARVILPSAESKDDSLLTRIEQLERAAKQNPSQARMGSTPPAAPKAPDGPPVAPVPTAPAVTHPAGPSPAPPMTAE
ncbi:MAG: DNA polymerase III subunit gamma and tau, partial [Candidatus Nanopelagicales bacterium]